MAAKMMWKMTGKMPGRGYGRLPKAVYYQCMWVVKDIDRLHGLEAFAGQAIGPNDAVYYEDEDYTMISDRVIDEAVWKLGCIREALNALPEEYRLDIVDSIVEGVLPNDSAHENTWRKWRNVFIRELAFKLNLI